MPNQPEQLYAVYSNHTNGRSLLGIATGAEIDIEAFFDDRKAYGLSIEPIQVQHIPAGYAIKRDELLQKRARLEEELADLNKQIKHIGG
jgi:hypothetical protein